ncbi:carotenoid biosynthesis protein [Mucilaginibacter lappiensis]|jgi:putative membrane protein|uniref:carotenoid biosynthesis protein n=1 Tax=Mucilaginibacter lappiensis TaxID=354630 RepID=UPI003D1B450E
MERAQNLKKLFPVTMKPVHRIAIIIIVLFHVVGFVGFVTPYFDVLFLKIVPWHLLLMVGVVLYTHDRFNGKFLLFALLIFTMGFMAEFTGVHTSWLFGSYVYGETLGIKLFSIPLMIGVNWFLLIYSTGVFMQRSRIKNTLFRIIGGAVILVLLDLLIEPIATQFDYWHWTSNNIPIKNYICWFMLSALMLFVFEKFKFKQQSMIASVLLFMQFIFFMALGTVN